MEHLREVRDAFGALARALKRISIYRHAKDQHASYLEPALQALLALLEVEPSVRLQVEPDALLVDGETVYSEPAREGSLCFRLHRDGVRSLTFERGLKLSSLQTFMTVALPDEVDGPGREDAVTELWKANLEAISYSAVPGYRMEQNELDRERAQNAIIDVSERAGTILQRFGADLDEDAFRAQPPLLDDAARRVLDDGDWGPLARRATMTMLDLFQRAYCGRDLESMIEAYGRLVDEMLERRDALSLGLAIGRPTGMQGPQAMPFRLAFGQRLADPTRAAALLALGQAARPLLPSWTKLLPDDAGAMLLDALDAETDPEVQSALAVAAAERVDQCRTPFGNRLRSGKPAIVYPLLAALKNGSGQKAVGVAARALGHPIAGVRLEALALVATDATVAIHAVPPLLQDPEQKVRYAAAEVLAALPGKADEAAQALIGALEQPDSRLAERQELIIFHKLLGRLRTERGRAWLGKRLAGAKRRLLARKGTEESQLLAVQGLAADGGGEALHALEVASVSSHPPAVVAACKAAFHRLTQGAPGAT
jgi:hypothetical protein